MVGESLVLLAAGTSLFMAWTIGAGSSGSTPFAPAVGGNAISVMRAAFLVGILGLVGAVLQGAAVTEAVGTGLIHLPEGTGLSPIAAIVALSTAAGLVAVGVFAGYPIATAFTVTGAVVGAGLAMGGQPVWSKYQQIGLLWVAVPFAGGGTAYTISRILENGRYPNGLALAILVGTTGAIIANIQFTLLSPPGEQASISTTIARLTETGFGGRAITTAIVSAIAVGLLFRGFDESIRTGQRRFLVVLGGLVAFSAGGSQVGLALGPLLPLLTDQNSLVVPLIGVLMFGGFGLLLGSWTGAPRMIKALAQDYSSLNPRRSIAALVPSFVIAQTAVFFGIPVSFNEIIVSGIIGSGAAASDGSVDRRKILKTVIAWISSLMLALAISYGVYRVLFQMG